MRLLLAILFMFVFSFGLLAQNDASIYKEYKGKSEDQQHYIVLKKGNTFHHNFHQRRCYHCAVHTYTGTWKIKNDILFLTLDKETKKTWSIKRERIIKYKIKKKKLIRIIIENGKEKISTTFILREKRTKQQ